MQEEKKSFSDFALDSSLVEELEKRRITQPTPIQELILSRLPVKTDIVAMSNTGTGKTLAYSLPILHSLLNDDKYFYAIIILPTRELSQQVHAVLSDIGGEIGLRTTLLIGGVDLLTQGKSLANRPHIIVGTPGRIHHHLKNTKGITFTSFKYLVLDECDRLLDNDFDGDIGSIFEIVSPKHTLLFTATMTKRVAAFKSKRMNSPVTHSVHSPECVPEDISQQYVHLPQKHKEAYLYSIVRGLGCRKCIVFVGTCVTAERLERMLRCLGESVCSIHGNKVQAVRTETIEMFRSGKYSVLISTDVVARGMDMAGIKTIINYDMPDGVKEYIHRVGRTGRAGETGGAITFVTQYDVEDFRRLEIKLGKKMDIYSIGAEVIHGLLDAVDSAKREAAMDMKEEDVGRKIKEAKKGRQGIKSRTGRRENRKK
ncbi:ATP-dependent RNA helicase DDX47/RRP3 [Nematocida major]|uniref:ATP-dependent RNA helicase DDX47/RRP3 n=1 Tax=Nematocida major TaxID=1912982 RepID=UPI00200875F7|nr:ATP-dependent RNA helicase DDX47/RRP3 [Nematocida major]KAH9385139.1 ATP-dependent RNA helicase DDX47/RRP3 [Nematocida major]